MSNHILRVDKYSGHLKMIKKVTENLQKWPKLKIWDFAKMSPKMQQNTTSYDIFTKFESFGRPLASAFCFASLAVLD